MTLEGWVAHGEDQSTLPVRSPAKTWTALNGMRELSLAEAVDLAAGSDLIVASTAS